ncbi:nephrin-like, partial [Mizuhopecten yessoensis]|uniref:nephrin-like n=1 Tax=Mizuhopecten yessoensis TaxID=6573 RepID=UPI000B458392
MLRNMSDMYRRKLHAWVSPCKMKILILLLTIHSSTDAATLTGSSEYALSGIEFILTCTVPDEANSVQLYRRPDVTALLGSIQVAGGQCYNTATTTPVICSPDVCSCTATLSNYGTVFQWVIQPQTKDHGSTWFCRRSNPRLPEHDRVVESPDYTLKVAVPVSTVTMTTAGLYDPSVMITAGNNRNFLCSTSASRPVAKIAWFRGDKNITDQAGTAIDQDASNDMYTRQQSLTITGSVGDTDSGLKCEAVNIEGRIPISSQTSNIIIQWAPQTDPSLTRDPANETLTDGIYVTMTCRQVGGKPLATLTWSGVCSFWNTQIDSRDNTTVTSSIQFSLNKTYTGLVCICVSRHPVNSYQKSVNQTFDVL